jgi:hypothetical protein
MMNKKEIAKMYFEVSNQRDVEKIETMLDDEITYLTTFLKLKKSKKHEVMEMMRTFFEKAKQVHWDVEQCIVDDGFDGTSIPHYQSGDAILFHFLRTSAVEEYNNKKGREWVLVNEKGLIYHIRVEPIQE